MPTRENRASRPSAEGDSTPAHFLNGIYFVPVPDLSDEAVHTINAGRAMPAFLGILRALHNQGRRGRTEDIRADAVLGRLTIGINALARDNGMTDAAIRRQLTYLQRVGFIRVHDGEREPERDPVTGRIVKGRGRTPPKVIVMTLTRDFMRPSREGRQVTPSKPSQRPDETPPNPPLKGRDFRDRNRPPSRDADSKESASSGCRGTPDAGGPLEAAGPAAPPTQNRPADGRPAAPPPRPSQHPPRMSPAQRAIFQAKLQLFGDALGMTPLEVLAAGRADQRALRARVEAAGLNWDTGKRRNSAPPRGAILEARRAVGESLAVSTTQGSDAQEDIEERRARLERDIERFQALEAKKAVMASERDERRRIEDGKIAAVTGAIREAREAGRPALTISEMKAVFDAAGTPPAA